MKGLLEAIHGGQYVAELREIALFLIECDRALLFGL